MPPGKPRRSAGPPGEPRRVAYLYLLPALVVNALFLLFPLGRGAWISLFDWDGLTLGHWAGWDNYRALVADAGLRAAFGHVAVLLVFFSALPIAIGLVLATALHRARVRGMAFFRTALFLPQVVAMVVVGVAWRGIYAPDGALNGALRALGLGSWATSWLGDSDTALVAVGFVGTWVQSGLAVVLFLGGIGRIPRELFEAARLDGAGALREFRSVVVPSLRAEIGVAATLTTIAALRTFDLVYVMTPQGGPGRSTTVPAYEIYHRAFHSGQVGSAAALGVALTALSFLVTMGIGRLAGGERAR
ncbi:raffinose/stachyose/melibiose transport system permease protein [Streptoalloteichus tenebrarius]|uniref:Raffinose/stachyose/melibiose transport system permease protein n=1 Tax=Streptoalloteichus tenebrarius (strain ATCC 17920 / DSM 40477 / JCM 4838 / CBS 697.72 / NBRC 16177 / NCIMB 11028 / NRRL B-12390 / A12253. 1 / ISP 5477) TaxID=1933 RepID=A0ABT1HU61_STRSD|nr:sugar ABC transporter permease [Streptoalloteichus tenebrarius]MCP2259066.1 raffinose/stachyose/melibiose transport system permease protein [Streptoalloteichus tenebrarius]BFE99608.1 sugar ABC transporter permease [Streptoalloteichus tenebrarius]